MSRFFKKNSTSEYEPGKLISTRFTQHPQWDKNPLHIICDIDKTWLETRFESIFGLAKIAFEKAQDKTTVEGASEVLSAIRWGDESLSQNEPHPLHFVSSSPPQLRAVLEEKMALDCLDWTSDTFKDQSYNVKKGRWDLLTQQIPYKSIAILSLLKQMQNSPNLIFLGDNAEADPFIYLGIYLLLEKKINPEGFVQYLKIMGIDDLTADKIAPYTEIPNPPKVALLGIRNLDLSPQVLMEPLTDPIFWFQDYFELSVKVASLNYMTIAQLHKLSLIFHNNYGFTPQRLVHTYKRFGNNLKDDTRYTQSIERLEKLTHEKENVTPYKKDLSTFHSLRQDDILKLASSWHERLHCL